MKHLIYPLLLLILTACHNAPPPLTDYPEVANFTAKEQGDLRTIVAFMDELVCQSQEMASADIESCYEAFFSQLGTAAQAGEIFIPFSPAERSALLDRLQAETKQSIWQETPGPTSTSSVLAVRPKGKYADFVAAYGASNSTARTYHERLISQGFVSAGPFVDHLSSANQQEIPLQDERMRLLIAVQFLTMSTK